MCAALSAREGRARVLVVEKAPEAWRGGNGFFTAGGFRFAFKSFEELCDLVGDLSDEEKASMEVDPYTEEMFYDDLMRVTEDCADPDLAMLLVRQSQPTVRWMRARGVRWIPMFGRQAYKVDGRFRFWGGLVLEAVGGGPGLIDMEYQAAAKAGIDVRFETKAIRLLTDDRGAVTGIAVRTPAGAETIPTRAGVLAAGGFEANPEMRTRYLGRNWDLARVRGTPYNTGDGIRMALEIGALPWGHWSGCHAVQWDLNAPWHGDRKVGDNFQKHSYPLGLIVNLRGERFVDEGAAQVELGAPPRRAALRRLRGHDRHHVHVRRPPHHRRRAGRGHRAAADSRTLRGRRARGRALLPQLSGWRRPHGRRRVRPDRRALGGVERGLGGGASPPLIWWGVSGEAAPLHPTTNPSRTTRRTSRTRSARSSPATRRASRLPGSSPVESPPDRRSARAAPPR